MAPCEPLMVFVHSTPGFGMITKGASDEQYTTDKSMMPNIPTPWNEHFVIELQARDDKEAIWGHPKPRQRAAALCTPACKVYKTSSTGLIKIRDDLCYIFYPASPKAV